MSIQCQVPYSMPITTNSEKGAANILNRHMSLSNTCSTTNFINIHKLENPENIRISYINILFIVILWSLALVGIHQPKREKKKNME